MSRVITSEYNNNPRTEATVFSKEIIVLYSTGYDISALVLVLSMP